MAVVLLAALLAAASVGPPAAGAAAEPQDCGVHGTSPVRCWVVDSFDDGHDRTAGDGRCASLAGTCTLRAAIEESLAGTQYAIELGAGTYRLTLGQLVIPRTAGRLIYITVTGKGPGTTRVSGENMFRVFDVGEGSNLWLRSLTVEKGRNIPSEAFVGHSHGAGIHNHGNTFLTNVAVVGNAANLPGHNSGGGIANAGTGLFTMDNSTVVQNYADGQGGAIENAGELQLKGSTVALNMGSPGGGLVGSGAKVTLDHSLFAYNWTRTPTSVVFENCRVQPNAALHSLSTDGSCALAARGSSNRDSTDVAASSSHADERFIPAPGSSVVDAGAVTCGLSVDHEGRPRPADGDGDGSARCDIGAVELQPALAVTGFDLVDAAADVGLRTIAEGDVLDRRAYPPQLSVQALTRPDSVGSVVFELDGAVVRTENTAPYLLAGDVAGDVAPAPQLTDGSHILTATPYAGANGTGARGTPLTVRFSIITGPEPPAFTLVDADADVDVQPLLPGDVLVRSALPPNLTVRADFDSTPGVSSVVFTLDGVAVKTENVAPYALAGDSVGDYVPADLTAGAHTITAVGYDGPDGTGAVIRQASVTFTIQP